MARRVFCFVLLAAICIVDSVPVDEKALDCPANEEYYKCSLEACFKTCQDYHNPPPCPSIAPGCFIPACLCKSGELRNDEGSCVPVDQCRKSSPSLLSKLD